MKNTKRALRWIIKILQAKKVPFSISGGFASRIYGADRPLNDIDIDIPENRFDDIYDDVKKYVYWGPKRLKDRYWDLAMYMAIEYSGQVIDICGAYQTKVFDRYHKTWVLVPRDLEKVELHSVYGITVPIIPLKDLISYKKLLRRRVDLFDVKQLEEKNKE